MKTGKLIAKIAVALAAVAGVVFVVATYGEQIVAWCKKILASLPCKCKCNCDGECACECDEAAEEVVAEEAAEEAPAEEAPAEEAVEEAAEEAPADEAVAEDADFAE